MENIIINSYLVFTGMRIWKKKTIIITRVILKIEEATMLQNKKFDWDKIWENIPLSEKYVFS